MSVVGHHSRGVAATVHLVQQLERARSRSRGRLADDHQPSKRSTCGYAECFHPDRDPFWWNLIATPRYLRDGYLTLSDEPGLGWTLDWDYVNRYRVD